MNYSKHLNVGQCFFANVIFKYEEIKLTDHIPSSVVLLILLALQLYLGWKFVQTVLRWRHQAKEVAMAQKKADNFWQQR